MENARASLLMEPYGEFMIHEFPIPEPGPGQMLIRIELCGVCGTDVHSWKSDKLGLEYPISLGHEIVGVVEKLGPGVTKDYIGKPLKIGDRVGLCPAIHCHQCYFCTIAKTPEKCLEWKTYGTWPNADQEPHFNGGYSDYLFVSDPNTVVLKIDTTAERGVFLEPMAVIVHALLLAHIKPGDTVVVQGVGPIGLLTAAGAKKLGAAKIIAFGRKNKKRLALAKEMGCDEVICAADMDKQEDRIRFVKEHSLNGVGADVVFNTVGTPQGFKEALAYVRDSGTFVEMGNFVDSGTFDFNPCKDFLERGIRMLASFDNEAEHFVRAIPLICDETIPLTELITHRVPLTELQGVLDAIAHKGGSYKGVDVVKAVIDPSLG